MGFSIVFVIVAFALGYAVVPSATKQLLIFKYKEINKDWMENLRSYANHVSFVKRKPAFDGERVEKGMAKWAARQVILVNGGKLSYEKVAALREVGVIGQVPHGKNPVSLLPKEHEVAASYRMNCNLPLRMICGASLALIAAFLALADVGILACLSATVAGAVMISTLLCDMQARLIPWQLCIAFGAASVIFAACMGGVSSIATSIACAAAMYILLNITNCAMQFVSGSPAIGSGDLRFIPMICVFSGLTGTIWGFMGASVVMALIALTTVLFKGGNLKSYVPYAPGLSCWYAIGLIARVTSA